MSEATFSPEPPAGPRKSGKFTSMVIGVCAVVAIVVGITKMTRGLNQIFGGNSQIEQLFTDSDAALSEASKHTQAAAPMFTALLAAVDSATLEQVRADQRAAADDATKHFSDAASQFRVAAAKLEEALKLGINETHQSFVKLKATSYELLAQVCEKNLEIIRVVMDGSVATNADVVAQGLKIAEAHDAIQKSADEATQKADESIKSDQGK